MGRVCEKYQRQLFIDFRLGSLSLYATLFLSPNSKQKNEDAKDSVFLT